MKCILLAAGYATRMYPLTEKQAKPLLPINNKPIMNYILEKLHPIDALDEFLVVSNHKFYQDFVDWADAYPFKEKAPHQRMDVLDDGSTSNESRLGAIKDILMGIEYKKWEQEPLMVMAGDNIFGFPIDEWLSVYNTSKNHVITVRKVESLEERRKTGIAVLDENNKVIDFEEKPHEPKSIWSCPPFYLYQPGVIKHVRAYLDQGGNPDAPGHFLTYLHQADTVLAYAFEEACIDIGDLKIYESVKNKELIV